MMSLYPWHRSDERFQRLLDLASMQDKIIYLLAAMAVAGWVAFAVLACSREDAKPVPSVVVLD